MVETAAHLVDHVIPRVPIRQWVLTVPKRVRYFLQHDQRIFSGVLRVFMRAVNTAVRKHSPGAPRDASFGAVTFLHRAGSFLNEHPHMHSEVTDGVFAADEDGQVEFYPTTELTTEVVQNLQQTLRKRTFTIANQVPQKPRALPRAPRQAGSRRRRGHARMATRGRLFAGRVRSHR